MVEGVVEEAEPPLAEGPPEDGFPCGCVVCDTRLASAFGVCDAMRGGRNGRGCALSLSNTGFSGCARRAGRIPNCLRCEGACEGKAGPWEAKTGI